MSDVKFHWGEETFSFIQPLPTRLQAAFRHAVDYASDLEDLERVSVSLDLDGETSTFTLPATPALLTALRARRTAKASAR